MNKKNMENYLTQEEQRRIRVTAILILVAATVSVLAVNGTCPLLSQQKANGQQALSLEPPPIPLNGTEVTLTGDEMDRDISINPKAFLPMNGTQTITTAGATDLDINVFPPEGISVIIQNDTITVTNHPVTIEQTPSTSTAFSAAADSGSGGDEDEEE